MTTSTRARTASLVVFLGLLLTGLGWVARAPAADAAPGPGVYLLGDSVLAASAANVASVITPSYPGAVLNAVACRGLIRSCATPSVPVAPTTGVAEIQANAGRLGDVLVMELGYNDIPGAAAIDQAMTLLQGQDVPLVLWVNLSTLNRPEMAPTNTALTAAATRWPTLRVLDWNTASHPHPEWFIPLAQDSTGVHLSAAGKQAFVAFLKAQLDVLPGIGVPPPAAQHCSATVAVGSASPAPASSGAPSAASAGGRFTGITPQRLLDTRSGRPLGQGRLLELQVTGRAGAPATATAAVLNVTAVDPCQAGFLTVFPCGSAAPPLASNVNYTAGAVRPNLVVTALGPGGRACVYTLGQTDVVADLMGWFDAGGAGAAVPLAPRRLLDTRTGNDLGGGTAMALTVAGGSGAGPGAPADATGVILNVTAVAPALPGFLTVYPADATGACAAAARPLASNVNFLAGETIPNLVMVRVGGGGRVCVFSNTATDVVADLQGSFQATGATLKAAAPARLLDTRVGTGGIVGAVAADQAVALAVAGAGGATAPAGTTGVVLNVTAVGAAGAGFVTVYPAAADGSCAAAARPLASNLNVTAGQVTPNLVTTAVGGQGRVCLYTMVRADLVADLTGWMS